MPPASLELAPPVSMTDIQHAPTAAIVDQQATASSEFLQKAWQPLAPEVAEVVSVRTPLHEAPIEDAITKMAHLPHLEVQGLTEDMQWVGEQETLTETKFPVNRIVGIRGFQSWAGRGMDSNGELNTKDERSSAHTIAEYAKAGQPDYAEGAARPQVRMFTDADGEVWGYLDLDGAHRTAAAKMRGDQDIECDLFAADAAGQLPSVEFSVADELLRQDSEKKSFVGKLALRRSVEALVQKSAEHEAAFAGKPILETRSDTSELSTQASEELTDEQLLAEFI